MGKSVLITPTLAKKSIMTIEVKVVDPNGDMKSRILQTEIGTLTLVASPQGLQQIILGAADDSLDDSNNHESAKILDQAEEELTAYLRGDLRDWSISIDLNDSGTAFQKQVWQALRSIPYGETRTYKDIAVRIKRPNAVRAIGQANHHNPLPVVIPCHRVIGQSGKLGGYGGGLPLKQQLLELEARVLYSP